MTPDPLTAVLDQLTAYHGHATDLDTRETAHYAELNGQLTQLTGMVTTISRAFAEDTVALARLDALDRQVAELRRNHRDHKADDEGGYQPRPAPAWWKLDPAKRCAPLAELRDWVERVYRPSYGHLATLLSPCWPEHDLCLHALDIASQLWCVLYLQPDRTTILLSAQAEYQVRILPALAAQLAAETTNCTHNPTTGHPRSTP